jgi:hypothetical protein
MTPGDNGHVDWEWTDDEVDDLWDPDPAARQAAADLVFLGTVAGVTATLGAVAVIALVAFACLPSMFL